MSKGFTFSPMTFSPRCGVALAMMLMAPFSFSRAFSQDQPVSPDNAKISQNLPQRSAPVASVREERASGDAAPVYQTVASSASSMGAASGDYILKPGDSIDMVVYHEPDLSKRTKIGKDGMVQLPLLGEIKLGGLTVRDATVLVRKKYDTDYLVNPQIYLDIAGYSASKFTIIGQVGRPGTYDCSGSESLGLLEAIGMAGGFTRIADRGHVIVKRRDGNSIKTLKVNAKKLSDPGADRFEIKQGDVIDVHESWY